MPVGVVVGFAHDLRDALLDTRFLLAERAQLATPRFAATLTRLIDRPLQRSEHTFVCYPHSNPESVPRLCRNTAHSSSRSGPRGGFNYHRVIAGMLEKRWGRTLVWVLTVISLSAAALRLANVQPRAATIVFLVLGGSSYALNLARLRRAKRLRRERAQDG